MKNILINIKVLALLALLMFIFIPGCRETATKASFTLEDAANLPASFQDFYLKFHQDSMFQMTHILFPLKSPDLDKSVPGSPAEIIWTADNWLLHQPFSDEGGAFSRKFHMLDEYLITEYILLNAGGYALERRFAYIGEEWMLIHYSERNTILKPEETDTDELFENNDEVPATSDQ